MTIAGNPGPCSAVFAASAREFFDPALIVYQAAGKTAAADDARARIAALPAR